MSSIGHSKQSPKHCLHRTTEYSDQVVLWASAKRAPTITTDFDSVPVFNDWTLKPITLCIISDLQLRKLLNLSTQPSWFPVMTRFCYEPVHSCNTVLYFIGPRRIPKIGTLSFRRSRKTCNLLESSLRGKTSSAHAKTDRISSGRISMRLYSHEDRSVSITVSSTKLRIWKWPALDEYRFSWWSWVKGEWI